MATIGNTVLTLADWAKVQGPDGRIAVIIDLLSQTNEMMDDMLWKEGNLTYGERTTVTTGLPEGTWRALYQGVANTKGTDAQIEARCGNLESYSTVDKDLADLNGNTQEFRLTQDAKFFEGMTQQMQQALLYSSSLLTPAQIMGFTPQYNTLEASVAETANNVISLGGTASTNTSVWFVQWGMNTCMGIFPKGKMAGLMHEDLGRWTQVLPNGTQYEVYRSHFKWEAGLCVKDWRYVIRLCNIDVTQLAGGSAPNLINAFIIALNHWPTAPSGVTNVQAATRPSGMVGGGRGAIYANRIITTYLRLQATVNKTNLLLRIDEFAGKTVTMFSGVPIRTVDQLLSTEGAVS